MNRAEQLVSFYPSIYSYGPYAQPSYGAEEDATWSTEELIKGARTFLIGEDAQQESAVVQQKIINMQALADKSSGLIRNYYLNEISKLKAKLGVLQQQAANSEYSTQTLQLTQTSTAITSVLFVLIAGSTTIYLGTLIANKMKESKLKDLEIQRLQASMA